MMDHNNTNGQAGPDAAELQRRKTFERNKWLFSASGIGRDMAYQLIASFLLTYIQFGVSLTLAQFTTISLIIGVGGRIWDAVNDPMMGAIIEGTHMRWGKFKPWILIGALSCGLVIMAMFGIQSMAGWKFVVFMSVMYLLWESTFTMNDIGYWAMLPSLSSVKNERNSVTALTVLFAGVGAIIAQGVIPMLTVGDMRAGYRSVGIIVAAAFIGSQIMTSVGVKETPRSRTEQAEKISLKKMWRTICRNDQVLWMTLSMFFYNIASAMLTALAANFLYLEIGYNGSLYFYVVVAYGVPSVLVNILYPILANKLGRKKLQAISITAAVAGYTALGLMGWFSFFPVNIIVMCAFIVLISCGQSLFYMSSIVNMTNCVEYNDYKFGERNEAVVSTLRPFMAKFSAAMHTLIITLVLTISGTFLLSQSISALETQRDFFAKIDNGADQVRYIECLQGYIGEFGAAELGTQEYNTIASGITARISDDPFMSRFQLDAQYVPALGEAMVFVKYADGSSAEIGRLKQVDPEGMTSITQRDGSYLALEIGDLESGAESAANLSFRDKSTLSMRVWVRVAVTVVPIALLLLALYTQRKKFVIDEEYYDKMIEEIDRRKGIE